MPSLYESFGMVALEAMACGTPVVASDVGGLSFVVRDGESGFLVPERDPRALANCLGYLLRNPGLRERMGRRGIEVAREYAWSRHRGSDGTVVRRDRVIRSDEAHWDARRRFAARIMRSGAARPSQRPASVGDTPRGTAVA